MAAFDSLTSRDPHGLTNAAPWQTMGAAGLPDPSWAHVYHNDFDTYLASDWTVSTVGAPTEALTAADGGQLLITNSSGIADTTYFQLTKASFQLVAGKAAFFKFAGMLSDVINDVFYCGLRAASATPLSANDGLYLVKATGAATLQLVSKVGGVSTTVNLPTLEPLVNNTAFELGIMVDYLGNVAAFFNPTTGDNPISAANAASGASRGRVAALYAPGLTQVLLTPSFGLLNSTAVARTLQVDYITAVRNR